MPATHCPVLVLASTFTVRARIYARARSLLEIRMRRRVVNFTLPTSASNYASPSHRRSLRRAPSAPLWGRVGRRVPPHRNAHAPHARSDPRLRVLSSSVYWWWYYSPVRGGGVTSALPQRVRSAKHRYWH
ncbi:hypothetical protein HYPSUDRAFT_408112 [Hypholoma sublateritium FD-334 SS-4]|uniref:Uncharacterized protein n=1 Tax=Hypholoma sublateritium (strain FD-334 SS-4) TaxID=945553 RepID=A0A0D2LDT7_HYPSF|nr:hypothetical protein HYPSUDRAFT_408112 [Hypholoma sublateritium FD-334 SS-4]